MPRLTEYADMSPRAKAVVEGTELEATLVPVPRGYKTRNAGCP